MTVDTRRMSIDRACAVDGMTARQVELVVLKWAEEHPEYLHWSSVDAIRIAVSEAFPCPE